MPTLTRSDFDYTLPEHLIAKYPQERGSNRLLHVTPPDTLNDLHITDIVDLFHPNDLVVLNNTKVMHARLQIQRESGGRGEILIERILSPHTAMGQLKISRRPKIGERLFLFSSRLPLIVKETQDRWITVESPDLDFPTLLEQHGSLPLPLYFQRESEEADEERYQTVFAEKLGAVAAPTAGLHLTQELLNRLTAQGTELAYVTLHVGAGTFLPVKTDNLDEHIMHQEWFDIPKATQQAILRTKAKGGKVIAIGTTTLRALESAAQQNDTLQAGAAKTELFIRPGYSFKVVDRLFTNFHLPCSTLLMLVSAFGGLETLRKSYQYAIKNNYHFYSYGDAMLIEHQ